jgi:hypothetical protein
MFPPKKTPFSLKQPPLPLASGTYCRFFFSSFHVVVCAQNSEWYCVVEFFYMTTHQQDSSQPQQSQDSPHLGAVGLTMVEMEEATLAGILESGDVVLEGKMLEWVQGQVSRERGCLLVREGWMGSGV